jgi:hypothetical protein
MMAIKCQQKPFNICNKKIIVYYKKDTIKISIILIMTILILPLASSLLAYEQALAVDPSMMSPTPAAPPISPVKNADQGGAATDNRGKVTKQVTPDIETEAIIDSKLEKLCFDSLVSGIVDALSGEFGENAFKLQGAAMVSDQAAYEYYCYIAGGNILDLFLENP